jgi:Na+/H+ antiporter NhaC
MQLSSLILFVLTIWWIAFALMVATDKARKTRAMKQELQRPAVPPDVRQHTRWPSWIEYRARPSLFLIIPWCALLYSIVLVFIWPAIPINKFWLWTLRKKNEDHAA